MSDEIRKDDEMDKEQNTPDAIEPDDAAPAADETPRDEVPPYESPPMTGGDDPSPWGMNRRDLVKALATVPFVGALGYEAFRKANIQDDKRDAIANEVQIQLESPAFSEEAISRTSQTIRIGIIGNGGEGESLVRSLGFAAGSPPAARAATVISRMTLVQADARR